MRSALQASALLLAIGGCFGLVTAQHRGAAIEKTGDRYTAIVDDFDNEVTGSIGDFGRSQLGLSDEQRGFIFLGVMNLPGIPDTFVHVPARGMPLPEAIELHDIPAMVVRRIPQVAGYKFAKLEDRILLVSADTREVADMIPRYKLVFHQ
jgi:hypothetical protein